MQGGKERDKEREKGKKRKRKKKRKWDILSLENKDRYKKFLPGKLLNWKNS